MLVDVVVQRRRRQFSSVVDVAVDSDTDSGVDGERHADSEPVLDADADAEPDLETGSDNDPDPSPEMETTISHCLTLMGL